MGKLHVLLRKEDLVQERLANKVVVVLDVLFATSTIVTALQHGAEQVIPVLDEAAARAEARRHTPGQYLLAGEKELETPPGFAPYAPLALLGEPLAGKTLIYSTTNGTVALRQARQAAHIYVASLLNGGAIARHIRAQHVRETVLVVCAGSMGNFNLEDFFGAGYLVEQLLDDGRQDWELSDTARAACHLYQHWRAEDCLLASRLGRILVAIGLENEVRFAAQLDQFPILTRLEADRVRIL